MGKDEANQPIAEIKAYYDRIVHGSFKGNVVISGNDKIIDQLTVTLIKSIIKSKKTEQEKHEICYQINQILMSECPKMRGNLNEIQNR